MSLRWRIILLVMLGAVLSALAGLAVTVFNARGAVRMETRAAMELAAVQPGSPGSSRHLVRSFVADGQTPPAAPVNRSGVPDWFAALVWTGAEPIRVPAAGGYWLLRADPAAEVTEVWHDTCDLAMTAAVMLGLLLASLYLLVGRALAPLTGFGEALDRLAAGLPAGADGSASVPELAAIGRRIARLDQGLAAARAENEALSRSLIALQDRERADLARDLHDELGPLLFGIRVDAHALGNAAARGHLLPDETKARANDIAHAAAEIRALSRRILNRLRPMGLDHLPTAEVLRDLTEGMGRQHPGIRFGHSLTPAAFARSEAADLTLYRVAQEALLNAVRHGDPTRIDLTVEADAAGITLIVTDDGGGLGTVPPPGHGITGMRERVRALGGNLTIGVTAQGWTQVRADLPVPEQDRERQHG